MKTVQYLDAVKERFALSSDYAVSKKIGITRMAVSHYRAGKGFFSDEVAIKVADALGMHPGIVLLDMYAERTSNPQVRTLWHEVIQGFHSPLHHAKSDRRARPRFAMV